MRKYLIPHVLIMSFVFFLIPSIPVASEVEEKIKAYKQAIKINPDDEVAHSNLGLAYDKLGMYKEAIEAYKQAIRIKPDIAYAHSNLNYYKRVKSAIDLIR